MRHRRALLAFALILVTLSSTACALRGPKLAILGDSIFAVVASDSSGGMDAQIGGRVIIDGSGCYAITTEETGVRSILWPQGSFLDTNGLNIPGFTGGTGEGVSEGEPIIAGGGEIVADSDQAPCWDAGETIWQMSSDSAEYGFLD